MPFRGNTIYSIVIIALALLLVVPPESFAGKTYTWDGSESSDWNDPDNWDQAPGSRGLGENYRVNGASYTNPPLIDAALIAGFDDMQSLELLNNAQLAIQAGADLDVPLNLSIGVGSGSDLIVTGGTVDTESLGVWDANSTITISGGTVVINTTTTLGNNNAGGGGGTNGTPVLTVTGGTVTSADLVFDDDTSDTPAIVVSGGELEITGNVSSAGENVIIGISGTGLLDINGNLDMSNGIDLLTMTAGNLTLSGNWNNAGTVNLTNGTITFDGGVAQQITNTAGETFYNIIVNNTSTGVTLNDPILITNSMVFMDGAVNTTTTNDITFNDNATTSGASAASCIVGPVSKIGNDSFTFPVADGTNSLPITISAPSLDTDEFTAQFVRSNPHPTYDVSSKEPGLNNVSSLEYWILDRTAGSSNVTVTLNWNSLSDVGNLTDLIVARWNGTQWNNEGNGGTTGNPTAGTISSSGPVTSFSPFTLGSVSFENPLPVTLTSFDAIYIDGRVELTWETATEKNSSHYDIQKSRDGVNVETINTVPSKALNGNSNQPLVYLAFDDNISAGFSYYRLKQVDFDGAFEIFDFVYVDIQEEESSQTVVYPNPVTDDKIFVKLGGSFEYINFRLFDSRGSQVNITSNQGFDGDYEISPYSSLPPGIYVLNVEKHNGVTVSSQSHTLIVR